VTEGNEAGTRPDSAGNHVRVALDYDPTFLSDPVRLRRALCDLLPGDQRSVDLLIRAAELQVPVLVGAGRLQEALDRLLDAGGLRLEVSTWVLAAWLAALEVEAEIPERVDAPLAPPSTTEATPPAVAPAPSASKTTEPVPFVRVVLAEDRHALLAAATSSGFYVAALALDTAQPGSWRALAVPQSPLSRDLVLLRQADGSGRALWTDRTGVEESAIRMAKQPAPDRAGDVELHLGGPQRLLNVGDVQTRYPLHAIAADGGDLLDVMWTADRQKLYRSTIRRQGSTSPPVELPPCCYGKERLMALVSVPRSTTDFWLVALTDRGRVLLTRWDARFDHYSDWTSAVAPVPAMAGVATLASPELATLFAVTAQAKVLSVDIRGSASESWPWRNLGRPDGIPETNHCTSVAALADAAGDGHLVLVTGGQMWICPVSFDSGHPRIGTARPIPFELVGLRR
jgi:hypothetical protein